MSRAADFDVRLRAKFENARTLVARAHERAQSAVRRSAEIREALSKARTARPEVSDSGPKAMALLHLAAEESARSAYEKDRFLAIASHELRQPLSAAQAALEVLEVSRTEPQASRARAVLRRQLVQMGRLVEDLLEISRSALRSNELSKTTVDLRRPVEAAVEATAAAIEAAHLTLHLQLPAQPMMIAGDEPRLVQVFTNLLSNALRYTPPGGQLEVAMQAAAADIITEVADTGRGIDPADLPRVFEPFARGRSSGPEGLGIGLALVRSIVERHGGSVRAVSDGPDLGSRFTIILPAISAPEAADDAH